MPSRMMVLAGCSGLLAWLCAFGGPSSLAYASSGTTATFTSAQIGTSGETPQFFESGVWQMAWSYDCSSFGASGNFIVDINGGSN